MWEGGSEEDEEWRVGHPIVFPNTLLNGRKGWAGFQIRVPIDDEHTRHWWYNIRYPDDNSTVDQDRPARYEVPVSGLDAKNRPTWDLLDNNSGQDMVMWYSQGPIMDRSTEKLGVSDKGVILYRKLLDDSIAQLERGEDPINTYRDPAKNILINIPYEQTPNRAPRNNTGRVNTGASAKYDPVANIAGMESRSN
jgi:5,5'-dehydrodivanillate O-demethylase oxygenase subunit